MDMMDDRITEENRIRCPRCGRDVSKEWNFCPHCCFKIRALHTNQTQQE